MSDTELYDLSISGLLRTQREYYEDKLSESEALLEKVVEALKPFSTHVDKSTCTIKMVWQDGDYVSTYINTLKPAHFEAARTIIAELGGQDNE